MKKNIVILLLLPISVIVKGQDKFEYSRDFQSILKKTKDSNSSLHYDKLLKRFKENDSTF